VAGSWARHLRGSTGLAAGEPVVSDWPDMTLAGHHDLRPGAEGGLIDEHVTVEVTSSTVSARMLAFEPDGTPASGISDAFDAAGATVEPIGDLVR